MNLEKLFHLKENHTDVKTEVMAGITTFMTMAYILAVNPSVLGASAERFSPQQRLHPQSEPCSWHYSQITRLYWHRAWD